MHKSKYTVTHTYTLCESVCAHFFVWEITFSTACTNFTKCCCWSFFYVLRAFPLLFFFLRWAALFFCQIIAIITWNMETLRFAYKFISAGLLGCWVAGLVIAANRTTTTTTTRATTTRRWLRNWMTDALATVPPPPTPQLLQHLPHTQCIFAGVLGSHFLEFCSAPFRTEESWEEKRNSHGVNMLRYIFFGTVL